MTATQKRSRIVARGSRPLGLWLYIAGAVGLGVSALFGGGNLLLDPTGTTMEMPVEMLAGTPFQDFFIPGAILFSVLGVGSFVVLYGIIRRREWAWPAAVGLGVTLVGWISIQMLLLQTVNILQLVYGALGLVLVGLAMAPSVRSYLQRGRM